MTSSAYSGTPHNERVFDLLLGRDRVLGTRDLALEQHRLFLPRHRRPLVEQRVDLPLQLTHGPATSQRLGLVEPTRELVLDAQQANVVRPRQRQAGDDRSKPRSGFSRRCLENLVASPVRQFSRRCLENVRVRQVERTDLPQVAAAEPAPEARGQIARKALDQLLAVSRAPSASLLLLDNPAPDRPVARRHHRVDRPRGLATGRPDHVRDLRQRRVVRRCQSLRSLAAHRAHLRRRATITSTRWRSRSGPAC